MRQSQSPAVQESAIGAHEAAALSAALGRLAVLRRQIHPDWSRGAADLLAFANGEEPDSHATVWTWAQPERAPIDALDPFAAAAPEPFDPDTAPPGFGAGAVALLLGLDAPTAPTPRTAVESAFVAGDDIDAGLGAGAIAGFLALDPPAPSTAAAARNITAPDEAETGSAPLGVGAFALPAAVPSPQVQRSIGIAPAPIVIEEDAPPFAAAGAVAGVLDALAATPPPSPPAPVRPFDPESLIDDALADAFETLLSAPQRDAVLWSEESLPVDDDMRPALDRCEAELWDLPRHVPCIEIFRQHANHEIAVKLTRALRLRAHALQARAFADGIDFGSFASELETDALWLTTDASADTTPVCGDDVDAVTSLPDWGVTDEGLLVVTAPELLPPRPAPPLITEEELDALFAHVDDARARVVLDDIGDEPAWSEPYWADVDAYLMNESVDHDPADADPRSAHDAMHDIDVVDAPLPPSGATHFWMPGDAPDLAVSGDGADLFIVGADDAPAVVLVEDGATHAMRTGQPARMDEVVVSLSHDRWTHVDAMTWTRLAVLSGVAQIRIEQNAEATRHAVVAGVLAATGLRADGVRLTRALDDGGEREYVVEHLAAGWALEAA